MEALTQLRQELAPRGLSADEVKAIGWPGEPIAAELLLRLAAAVR